VSKIKLSVLMPSYNKGPYIRQSIDSVLNQKTNFDFNLIITDDCSTDETLGIINEYVKKYPRRVILLPSDKNQGLLSNIIKAYKFMNCEYFCCLDPDDYLTDEHFYQNAVDFLESHKDFSIYAANTSAIDENGKIYTQNTNYTDEYYDSDFQDMLVNRAPLGNTISSVFRNDVIDADLISKIEQFVGSQYDEAAYREDDFRNRIHLQSGRAHWVNNVVGVYRYTPSGLYRASNRLKKHLLKIVSYINMYMFFDKKYPEFMVMAKDRTLQMLHQVIRGNLNAVLNFSQGEVAKFFEVMGKIVSYDEQYADEITKQIMRDCQERRVRWYEYIFSVKKAQNHKVLYLLGLKIKL